MAEAGTREYLSIYTRDPLGRLTRIEDRGTGSATTAEVHAFSYFTAGGTASYTRWRADEPSNTRTRTFMPDALGRLREHELVDASPITNYTTYVDWIAGATGSGSGRTRIEREDGEGNLTWTHYDFAGRPVVEQRPGSAHDEDPNPATPAHSLFASYDAASRISEVKDGSSAVTRLYRDGMDRLVLREVPHVDWFTDLSSMATREVFQRDRLGRIEEASTWTGEVTATNPLLRLVAVGLDQDSTGRVHEESYDFTGLGYGTTSIGSGFGSAFDLRESLTYSEGFEVGLRVGRRRPDGAP